MSALFNLIGVIIMGMDIYGRNPKCKAGAYISYTIGSWGPVAEYILKNTPKKITKKCKRWYSNDYDGLNAADCLLLANILEAQIKDGTTTAYVKKYNAYVKSLPRKERNFYVKTSIKTIQRFVNFLGVCGGFSIG